MWVFFMFLAGAIAVRTGGGERRPGHLRAGMGTSLFSARLASRPRPSADPAEEADLRHHRAAISRCTDEKRVAVIGYGWKIVCIDPKFVAWSEGPISGHDPGGI